MNLMHAAHVPAGDGPFPTVVALHGWGSNAHDLLGLAPILQRGEALVICPQGPLAMEIGQGMMGYGWFPITGGGESDPEDFARGTAALREFLDTALEHYPVDPHKLVLMGFSQGGVMAYDLFLREPQRFAGLVAMSSWLPAEVADAIPAGASLEGHPALVIHGTNDEMIPVDRARESRTRLTNFGTQLTYREYEMGHEINGEALRELVGWLDEKVLNPIQLVR